MVQNRIEGLASLAGFYRLKAEGDDAPFTSERQYVAGMERLGTRHRHKQQENPQAHR